MVKNSIKKQKGLLERFKESFDGLTQCEELDLKQAYRLEDKKVRLKLENYPIQINIGPDAQTLHIYPEQPVGELRRDLKDERYIVFNPKTYYKEISGFLRIKSGDKLILGSGKQDQKDLLRLTQDISEKHLRISNDEGQLVFKSFDQKRNACVSPLLERKQLNRIRKWRVAKLKRLRSIYGGPIELESPENALALIKQVNKVLKDDFYREKDRHGMPGGVVELPSDITPVLVGDLHAKIDNLLIVLSQSSFLKGLKKGTAALIILGDAVHCEEEGKLEEMESSMLIMDLIFKLKLKFPKQVFYLRGNHDSFSDEIGKQGVPQGTLWKKALVKTRGDLYKDEMTRFYDHIPYIAYSSKFITCHAGAPTSSTSREELVNIRDYPKLIREVTQNRIKRPNSPSGYFKKEVKKLRGYFGLEPDAPFIVGHTPISSNDTLWERVGEIDNHYIIYASYDKWVGAMVQVGEKVYPFRYPAEHLIPLINEIEG